MKKAALVCLVFLVLGGIAFAQVETKAPPIEKDKNVTKPEPSPPGSKCPSEEACKLWEEFKKKYGENWQVRWNTYTEAPEKIFGYHYDMGVGKVTDENKAVSITEKFISDNKDLLKVNPSDLKLSRVVDGNGAWRVEYQQYYQGVPVKDGRVFVVMTNTSKIYDIQDYFYPNVSLSTTPTISENESIEIAKGEASSLGLSVDNRTEVREVSLVVFPKTVNDSLEYYLTWKVSIHTPFEWGYEFFVDAQDGKIVHASSTVKYGTMRIDGTVSGYYKPQRPSDSSVSYKLKDLYVQIMDDDWPTADDLMALNITDNNGYYDTGWISNIADPWPDEEAEVYVYSNLSGPHTQVYIKESGELKQVEQRYDYGHLSTYVTHDWNGNDWTKDGAPLTSDESSYVQNIYYHITWIRDYFAGPPFSYPNLENPPVRVGVSKDDYESSTDVFDIAIAYSDLYTGKPHALSSDVIYHEYMHTIVRRVYGGSIGYCDNPIFPDDEGGTTEEAVGDYYAATLNNDPDIGSEVLPSSKSRNLDNTIKLPPGKTSWDCHYDSQILSGALWDMRQRISPSSGGTADILISEAMKLHTPTTFQDMFGDLLTEDDRIYGNSNTLDGTPHGNDIWQAFYEHGMDYDAVVTLQHSSPLEAMLESPDNNDIFKFDLSSSKFAVAGIRPPSGSDYDLEVYSDPPPTGFVDSSVYTGSTVDFVVLNGFSLSTGDYYASADRYSGSGIYQVEMENNTGTIGGGTIPGTFTDKEVLDAYQISLTAGTEYEFSLTPPGSLDVGIFLFSSTGGRNDAVASSDSYGAGGAEPFTYTPSTTGYYAVVVTNENGGAGSYTLEITTPGCVDTTPPNTPTLYDPGGTDTDGDYQVDWSDVSDVGCAGLSHYELQESNMPSFGTVSYNTSSSFYDFYGKENGDYYYRVRAWDNTGNPSAWSNVVDITVDVPPPPPPPPPSPSWSLIDDFTSESGTVYNNGNTWGDWTYIELVSDGTDNYLSKVSSLEGQSDIAKLYWGTTLGEDAPQGLEKSNPSGWDFSYPANGKFTMPANNKGTYDEYVYLTLTDAGNNKAKAGVISDIGVGWQVLEFEKVIFGPAALGVGKSNVLPKGKKLKQLSRKELRALSNPKGGTSGAFVVESGFDWGNVVKAEIETIKSNVNQGKRELYLDDVGWEMLVYLEADKYVVDPGESFTLTVHAMNKFTDTNYMYLYIDNEYLSPPIFNPPQGASYSRSKAKSHASPGNYSHQGKAYYGRESDDMEILSQPITIIVTDNIAPSVTITAPADGAIFNTTTIGVSWTGSDVGLGIDHYEVKLDSQEWIPKGTATSHTYTSVSEGLHTIYVKAVDKASNSATDSTGFRVDTTAPQAPVPVATPSGWSSVNSFSVDWTNPSDASGIAGAYYKLDALPTSNTDGTWTTTKPITGVAVSGDGSHPIYVWLKDNAGNVDYTNYGSTTLNYDGTPPSAPSGIIWDDGAYSNDTTIIANWDDAADTSGIVDYYLQVDVDSTDFSTGMIFDGWAGSSVSSKTLTGADGVAEGQTYYYRVRAKNGADLLSNWSNISSGVVVDTSAPVITGVQASSITDTEATITWNTDEPSDSQVEYGLTIVYGNSTPLNTTLTTSHAQVLTGLSPSTTYYYRVKSRDAAGNLAMSGDYSFTTAPAGNTPIGTNVTVDLGSGNLVTFAEVTASGNTSDNASETNKWGSLPGGFRAAEDFHDITTTAGYTGGVIVSLWYNESRVLNESNVKILHWNGTAWEDVTISLDPAGNTVNGSVTTLSPFVVAENVAIEYERRAKQGMGYVTSTFNNHIDQITGLLWSDTFTGDLANAAPCWDGSYFYHTARAVMGEQTTNVRTDLADVAVNRVFVDNYREDGTWSYPHEPWFGRMSYPNNDGLPWPNNSIYEDAQAWQLLGNVLTVMNSMASTEAYPSYVEKLIDGILYQDVPVKDGYAYNSSTGAMQYYNGSAWLPATRYTAIFVAIMQKTNSGKYNIEISKGMQYLDNNTIAYIETYPTWKAYLAPYFLSTYALMGNQSMVDKLFSDYIAEYGDGVNFTHEIQLTHAGNASINSVLYHAKGLDTLRSAYSATSNTTYLAWAQEIADHMILEHFDPAANYFTNLNEMDTSRSNYCNYQKGLAEINGVAAYALMKLASVNSSSGNSYSSSSIPLSSGAINISSDSSSLDILPRIQVRTSEIRGYTQFRVEADITNADLKNVTLLLDSAPLEYDVHGKTYSSVCLGPFAEGTMLNFSIIAEDMIGNIAQRSFSTAVSEEDVEIKGNGKHADAGRTVDIELEAKWRKGDVKGEFQLDVKARNKKDGNFKAHGKIDKLYADCDGVFRISGSAKVTDGKARNKVAGEEPFTGEITGDSITILLGDEEFKVPVKVNIKEESKRKIKTGKKEGKNYASRKEKKHGKPFKDEPK